MQKTASMHLLAAACADLFCHRAASAHARDEGRPLTQIHLPELVERAATAVADQAQVDVVRLAADAASGGDGHVGAAVLESEQREVACTRKEVKGERGVVGGGRGRGSRVRELAQ
eukprot:6174323-Pleurochrysis_carterae.AAC.4